ncbi:MAG: hypothetical protein ACXW4Q_16460 [Anaerolineales bacterium]
MLTSIPGVYRKGMVELQQKPKNVTDETRVIVTFLDSGAVDLLERGVTKKQARQLREQLGSFAEELE